MGTDNRIRQARIKRGWTQKQLAEHLGVTMQAVSQWENDRTVPQLANYLRLSDLLKVDFDWIRGDNPRLGTDDIVPSDHQIEYGELAPVVNLENAVFFSNSLMVTKAEWFDKGTVRPTNTAVGKAFAVILDDRLLRDPYSPSDILIFDSGITPKIGDVIISIAIVTNGKYETVVAELIQENTKPGEELRVSLRPIDTELERGFKSFDVRFLPHFGVMIEHRRLRQPDPTSSGA